MRKTYIQPNTYVLHTNNPPDFTPFVLVGDRIDEPLAVPFSLLLETSGVLHSDFPSDCSSDEFLRDVFVNANFLRFARNGFAGDIGDDPSVDMVISAVRK